MKKQPRKHEQKKKGKTIPKSKRKQVRKNARTGRTNRKAKSSRPTTKRKVTVSKVVNKPKVLLSKKQSGRSQKATKPATRKPRTDSLTIAKRKRGKEMLNVSFGKTRKVETKIKAFETSKKLTDSIKKQLKRKGGKPPKGMVIVVRDKKGNEAAHLSRPSFVANEKNIKKELAKFTKELKKDYSKFSQKLAERQKGPKQRKPRKYEMTSHEWEGEQLGGGGSLAEGYEDYNPDNIQEIDIKFIYSTDYPL